MSSGGQFEMKVQARRQNRMAMVDSLSPETRACIHDYGLKVVLALLECGVTKPARIRHVVETVLDEFSPTRGSNSYQGVSRANGISKDLSP